MSNWDDHITNLLATNNVNAAAILDLAAGTVLTHSPNLSLSTHSVELKDETGHTHTSNINEIQILQQLVENRGIVPSPPGIWINKETYHLIRWDDDLNMATLKSAKGGAAVMRTNKCIIVGTWVKQGDKRAGDCNMEVARLGESFLGVNY